MSPSTSPSASMHPRQSMPDTATPQTPATIAQSQPASQQPSTALSNASRIGIGQLWNSRGAASYHGSSYFGHQSAASMMQVESPDLPTGMTGIYAGNQRRALSLHQAHRTEKGPYSHIWELVGCLPRRKTVVDRLVRRFLDELEPVYDSIHEETFQASYEAFWNRKWGDDDLTAVDLRWLALLFMMLSFAELLDCPVDASADAQRTSEETSMQYFWAARKAIVLAPTFSGESPDLVRSGILVSRYLVFFGRKTEAWLTSSFAIRMAQAQGMHIDGESWGLPPKVLETRRRLWCKLYSQDRSISLAIGRPYTINDKHCMKMNITNVWVDNDNGEAEPRGLDDPTPSVYYACQQDLSAILGQIHDECFGLVPIGTSYSSYEKVMALDRTLLGWVQALPPYFQLSDADTSMDQQRPYLPWQRMYLHSSFHFARITLHRTYVVLESITDRFQYSRDACISSACADLKLKLGLRNTSMADRLNAGGAMHNLFNSGLVLGIIAVRDPFSARTNAILEDLAAYCEKLRGDPWTNEFALAELKVIELCIASARRAARNRNLGDRRATLTSASSTGDMPPPVGHATSARASQSWTPAAADSMVSQPDMMNGIDEAWLDNWFGPTRNFPEPGEVDFQFWEDLVGTLEVR
ncbi:fungal specific transcription factor domain-containing protein [Sarocladium implicatum]|nr:fungal specific transcription factor domain-containing protein [Sarocladium implicatum]